MALATIQLIAVLIPIGYLAFAIWSAYSSGYTAAVMKKHKPEGMGKYAPYLGLLIAYSGVFLM